MKTDYIQKHHTRRRRNKRFKIYLQGAVIIIFIVSGISFFIHASVFQVKKISIIGIEEQYKEEFLQTLTNAIPKNIFATYFGFTHYFSWPNSLAYTTAQVSSIEIEKNIFTREVSLSVDTRRPFAIWCFGINERSCAWIDEGGIAIKEAPKPEGLLIMTVYDTANPVAYGKTVHTDEYFKKVVTVAEYLRKINLSYSHLSLERLDEELSAITPRGTKIIFNLRSKDISIALKGLKALVDETSIDNLEYIDLTVDNKVYVKRK